MVTNRFVNQPDHTDFGFQNEFDSILIESIQFYGHDVTYIPRELVNEDELFGEDTISRFKDTGCIEMYIENVDGFEGDKEFIAQFGIEIRDQATFVVSVTRWKEEQINDQIKPKEGDLIYMPLTNDLFEVRFVEDDRLFFQQNRTYIYTISCEKFDYSFEEFDTGIPELDSIDDVLENDDDSSNDPFSDNFDIQTDSDAIKDFDEEDPFGSF